MSHAQHPNLVTALLAAQAESRQLGPLPRDERAPAPKGARSRDEWIFPSQEAVQRRAGLFMRHGLVLEPVEATVHQLLGTFRWRLSHVGGEHREYRLDWSLFTDVGTSAHNLAATWTHAERHLVLKILQAEIEGRKAAGERANLDDLGDLPDWAEAKPAIRETPADTIWGPVDAGEPPPESQVASDPEPPADQRSTLDLFREWRVLRCEAEASLALNEGREPNKPPTIEQAWAECSGRHARRITADEQPQFSTWLRGQIASMKGTA